MKSLIALGALLAVLVAPAGAQTLVTYDGFAGEVFDPARWRGYEHTIRFTDWSGGSLFSSLNDERDDVVPPGSLAGAQNLESRREITDDAARLYLKTAANLTWHDTDWTQGKGRLGLRVSDPALADHVPAVRAMQATVTITGTGEEATCPYPRGGGAHAEMRATFFNDGSSTGPDDRTGDMTAVVTIVPHADGTTSIGTELSRCSDARCAWIRGAEVAPYSGFTLQGRHGDPHVVTLRWDEARRRVVVTAATGSVTERAVLHYAESVAPAPPVGFAYDLRVDITPGACGGPVASQTRRVRWIDTRFDRVRLATDAAAGD